MPGFAVVATSLCDRLCSWCRNFLMSGPDLLRLRRSEQFRIEICAPLAGRLFFFHGHGMRLCIGVIANTCDLPGNLHPWFSACDRNAVAVDFLRTINRGKAAHAGP